MPADPATTSTADAYLCASHARSGNRTSAGSTNHADESDTSSPMSTTDTTPTREGSANNRPGFNAANVTVASATTDDVAVPVSGSRPDGTSTASTSAPSGTAGGSYEPRKPVP